SPPSPLSLHDALPICQGALAVDLGDPLGAGSAGFRRAWASRHPADDPVPATQASDRLFPGLKHDPEKCEAVFRTDHAQTIIPARSEEHTSDLQSPCNL